MPRDLVSRDERLAAFVGRLANGTVANFARTPLEGGAVLRHDLLEFDLVGGRLHGAQRWVLRADPAVTLGLGMTRAHEFSLLRTLHRRGLPVPAPLFMCCDAAVAGTPFLLMRFVPGEASGAALTGAGAQPALAASLGGALARLHRMDFGTALHFLPPPPRDPAAARLAELARHLAADGDAHPVAEWALRWLAAHKPEPAAPVLCHGDFRTGNYLVAEGRLAAILDWDFAGWSDPDEDIAWFCASAWRFAAPGREAGGIARRAPFYDAYEAASRRHIDPRRVRYWEVMAALRWLAIALKQRDRFARGEASLDLALTGRRPAECEHEILRLTGAWRDA